MKIKSLLVCLLTLLAILVVSSCDLFVKPPAEPQFKKLSKREVRSYRWLDDLDLESLEQAIKQSKQYFGRLPSDKRFKYGGMTYSPKEMADSLNLFLDIMKDFQGKEQMRKLKEKFLFFESRNAEGNAFFTGYYEPLLEGSLVPTNEFPSPLYGIPDDLIEVDLGQFGKSWEGDKVVGRLDGNRLVPYDERDDIVYNDSLKNRAKAIAYADEIELFFLQIQGSGLIKLPDGRVKRVNYAQKNGHPYRAIGRVLQDRIPPDKMSLQSIREYLYANPDEVRNILSYNPSYTFFREVEEGPLGNIDVPLTPGRSIAMDSRIIPRGGLAFIDTELPVFDNDQIKEWKTVKRFVLVQDTGGAIRDHGRVDIFFGHGEKAALTAGHLKQRGRVFVIIARKAFL
jgi:membrane-bound lytic murein transglycosylase A